MERRKFQQCLVQSSPFKMVNLRLQTFGPSLVIMLSVILTLSVIYVDAADTDHAGHVHTPDHEGTQGYGDDCLMASETMQCKSGKGFHCDGSTKKATCICLKDFKESYYKKENDTCMAKINNICRISQVSIPCDDPMTECTDKNICECKKGLKCESGGVPIIPGFTVLMTLAIATGLTYSVM